MRMDPEKISAIKSRLPPNSIKSLQAWLGLTNYYRKFVLNYAKIAAPLHQLTSKSTKWNWTPECQEAFEKLKEALVAYPILRSPDYSKKFVLHTDASHLALGAILAQEDDQGKEYVCYYASKLLKDSERRYGISELECLAIIWSVNAFRVYLYNNHFTIVTDHIALKWLMSLNDPSARLSRWSILLQQFSFDIKHRKGIEHSNADALSRPVLLNAIIARNNLEQDDHTTKLLDPYEDDCLLHFLKYRKHVPGATGVISK